MIFRRGKALDDRLLVQIEVEPGHAAAAARELHDLLSRTFDVPCDVEPVEVGAFVRWTSCWGSAGS